MTKYEFYTAIALITIILISILWKAELHYRRDVAQLETATTTYIPPTTDTTYKKHSIGKNKQNGEGWMDAYEKGIIFNYKPKWDEK